MHWVSARTLRARNLPLYPRGFSPGRISPELPSCLTKQVVPSTLWDFTFGGSPGSDSILHYWAINVSSPLRASGNPSYIRKSTALYNIVSICLTHIDPLMGDQLGTSFSASYCACLRATSEEGETWSCSWTSWLVSCLHHLTAMLAFCYHCIIYAFGRGRGIPIRDCRPPHCAMTQRYSAIHLSL